MDGPHSISSTLLMASIDGSGVNNQDSLLVFRQMRSIVSAAPPNPNYSEAKQDCRSNDAPANISDNHRCTTTCMGLRVGPKTHGKYQLIRQHSEYTDEDFLGIPTHAESGWGLRRGVLPSAFCARTSPAFEKGDHEYEHESGWDRPDG